MATTSPAASSPAARASPPASPVSHSMPVRAELWGAVPAGCGSRTSSTGSTRVNGSSPMLLKEAPIGEHEWGRGPPRRNPSAPGTLAARPGRALPARLAGLLSVSAHSDVTHRDRQVELVGEVVQHDHVDVVDDLAEVDLV